MSHFVRLDNTSNDIAIPTVAFNAVYQLGHIMIHIEDEGVGLRQFVDYYFVLKNLYGTDSKIKERIRQMWKKTGMLRLARAVMWIEKEMLGLPETFLLVDPNERLGRLLAKDILEGGNFGHFGRRQKLWEQGFFIKRFSDTWHLIRLSSCFPGDAFYRLCYKVISFIKKYIK